jgi:hypothetical protein
MTSLMPTIGCDHLATVTSRLSPTHLQLSLHQKSRLQKSCPTTRVTRPTNKLSLSKSWNSSDFLYSFLGCCKLHAVWRGAPEARADGLHCLADADAAAAATTTAAGWRARGQGSLPPVDARPCLQAAPRLRLDPWWQVRLHSHFES